MSRDDFPFYNSSNVNPEVKVDETSTEISHVQGTRILFNSQKKLVIIGNTAIEYHRTFDMYEQLWFYLTSNPITLDHSMFNVRTVSADDIEGAVKFQRLRSFIDNFRNIFFVSAFFEIFCIVRKF